ncbi:hypothetical protein [Pseudonocardia sp. D17]|uniref:hypothetical protein n=1 Tax=Pseudonocardia sp. D17 TaxID=882661 RepID=UPI0030CE1E0D
MNPKEQLMRYPTTDDLMPQAGIRDESRPAAVALSPAVDDDPGITPAEQQDEARRLQLRAALVAAATQIVLAMGDLDADQDCSPRLSEASAEMQHAVALSRVGSAA